MPPTRGLAQLFVEAGWPGYAVVLVGVLATAVAALALGLAVGKVRGARWAAGLALLGAAATVGAGLAGMAYGRLRLEQVLALVNLIDKEVLLRQGYKESLSCLLIALGMAVVPALLALVAAGLGAVQKGPGASALAAGGLALTLAGAGTALAFAQPLPGRDPVPETEIPLSPPPPTPPTPAPPADPSPGPALSSREIREVLHAARGQMKDCFQRGLGQNPSLGGKVILELTIAGDGRVKAAQAAEHSTLRDSAVQGCLLGVARSLRFPPPRDGAELRVDYPVVFSASR